MDTTVAKIETTVSISRLVASNRKYKSVGITLSSHQDSGFASHHLTP
jgi:hypothetical protein